MTRQQVVDLYNTYVDQWNEMEVAKGWSQEKYQEKENAFVIKVSQYARFGYKTKIPDCILITPDQEQFLITFTRGNKPQFYSGWADFRKNKIDKHKIYFIPEGSKKVWANKVLLK